MLFVSAHHEIRQSCVATYGSRDQQYVHLLGLASRGYIKRQSIGRLERPADSGNQNLGAIGGLTRNLFETPGCSPVSVDSHSLSVQGFP